MTGSGLVTPQQVAIGGIEGEKPAFWIAGENQIAGSGEDGGHQGVLGRDGPDSFSSDRVPGIQVSIAFPAFRQLVHKTAA